MARIGYSSTARLNHLERADRHALLAGQLDQQAADVHRLAVVRVGRVGHRVHQLNRLRAERLRGRPPARMPPGAAGTAATGSLAWVSIQVC